MICSSPISRIGKGGLASISSWVILLSTEVVLILMSLDREKMASEVPRSKGMRKGRGRIFELGYKV